MDAVSAKEAKTHFDNLLIKAQRAPIQKKDGKPVAVVVSAEDPNSMKALKLRLVQARARPAEADIEAGNLVDGEAFFNDIENGLRY